MTRLWPRLVVGTHAFFGLCSVVTMLFPNLTTTSSSQKDIPPLQAMDSKEHSSLTQTLVYIGTMSFYTFNHLLNLYIALQPKDPISNSCILLTHAALILWAVRLITHLLILVFPSINLLAVAVKGRMKEDPTTVTVMPLMLFLYNVSWWWSRWPRLMLGWGLYALFQDRCRSELEDGRGMSLGGFWDKRHGV